MGPPPTGHGGYTLGGEAGDGKRETKAMLRPKAVQVPNFPSITQLPQWKAALARSLVAASVAMPVDKAEIAWFNEVEHRASEELADSGHPRLHHLDALLAAALVKVLPKQLGIMVERKEQDALRVDSCVSGRQIVRRVYDWFKTDDYMSTVYSYSDLSDISWMGDRAGDMQKFLYHWDHILENMPDVLSEQVLRDIFAKQVGKPIALREDFAHYKRERSKGEDASHFTCAFLRRCVERFISNDRQERSLAERKQAPG